MVDLFRLLKIRSGLPGPMMGRSTLEQNGNLKLGQMRAMWLWNVVRLMLYIMNNLQFFKRRLPKATKTRSGAGHEARVYLSVHWLL